MKYIPLDLQGAYPRYGIHTSVFAVYALANNIHCLKKGTLDPLPSIFCHLWDSCSRSVLGSK